MSEKAKELWRRARQALATAERTLEFDPDAATSRSYYAAFYAVSALFAVRGRSFRSHHAVDAAVHRDLVHKGVISTDAGSSYTWLFRVRMTADYDWTERTTPTSATEACQKAREVIQAIERACPEFSD